MAYAMYCDKCRKVLKVDDNVVEPFTVIPINVPDRTKAKGTKVRYCLDCANELLDAVEETRRIIAEHANEIANE